MAISKLNAEQFANMAVNAAGVIFEYAGKDGKNTAMHFFGADYEATVKTQDEMFRVLRNVVTTFWEVKTKEALLRESNDGIRSKLRAGTPYRLIIRTSAGVPVKVFDLDASVWARIGLMPTKKDLERSARDRKKYIHNATKALMDALNFRVELPKDAAQPEEVQTEQVTGQVAAESAAPVTAPETVVEQPARRRGRKPKNGAEPVAIAA
ncbi:MAG: hypothetical protein NC250_09080 [Alistipes senegalensis]|nr:hypothetical protein [Bacteroides cellulosilyticus]MCM1352866.1 hypothetical protein [Alistipes senegalensis]